MSVERKLELLSYLAVKKFEQPQYVLFEQTEIEGYIAEFLRIGQRDSRTVLRAIQSQHGLLIERAQKVWSFSHLTFQEYFVAKWFVERADWQALVSHITKKHWREVFLLAVGMVQNADEFLQLMKQQVNAIASNKEIQQFLTWIENKCLAIESPYKLAALRAFCYAFEMEYIYYIDFALEITNQNLNFDLSNFISVNEAFYEYKLPSKFALAINIDSNVFQVPETWFYSTFGSLSLRSLQSLIEQFKNPQYYLDEPVISSNDLTIVNAKIEWWKAKGQAWLERLKTIIIDYRNSNNQWQFSNKQKELLQLYYDVNELLVDCLNNGNGCVVSDRVREEIEETLLLPIAEIQNRRGRQAGL